MPKGEQQAEQPGQQPRRRLRAIGLMSGTSMDGIDAALLETDGDEIFHTGAAAALPYGEDFRAALRTITGRPPDDSPETAATVRQLTQLHADAVHALLDEAGLQAADVDLLGFHGQTVFHAPQDGVTCQIGDSALLAELTGIDTISDFRMRDVAAGGEGAPFAPVYHVALSRPLERPLAVLNLGGVGNVTWISPDGGALAFDTGPANALIDDWVKARTGAARDEDGRLARQGRADDAILARLMENPYFAAPAPKSLDRDDFADALTHVQGLSDADGAATLTAFTARTVAEAAGLLPAPPLRWLVTGGGRHNPALMAALRRALGRPVEPVEAVGWNGDVLEAQAFAFLAVRSLFGMPLSYPQTTGVSAPTTGGQLFKAA